ncbi:hypothetical protein [Niallia nealsonii]|uniref:hypothetical protein n=1 Tax=Niallia nealsonii TaxID=115979 RepID=UPI0012FEECA2|nr:hypothetical protein [Niallia nealsonii]
MASLVNCRVCKKSVADTAKNCPHCGVDEPGKNSFQSCLGCGCLIVVAVVGYFAYQFFF